MIKKLIFITIFLAGINIHATNHGMYLKTMTNIKGNIEQVSTNLKSILASAGYNVLNEYEVSTPDLVRKNPGEHSGYKARLIVFTSDEYVEMLTSYGNKYLVASFLRVGLYETAEGIQIVIADPGTINRIIFNDMWENDFEYDYKEIIKSTIEFKNKLVTSLHSIGIGENVEEMMEPIRSDEDIREASRDMFMMVGKLTFFVDEDQFPQIYSMKNNLGKNGLYIFKNNVEENIKNFTPLEDDVEYRYTKTPDILKWKIVGEVTSPDSTAILLGITRDRTEALSFHIAGASREEETLKTPGIDHVAAYPIEVLIMQVGDKIVVHTPREMFRMDMYFWDAGMAAFMDHMSMPSILDEAIKKALLGNDYMKD